MAELGMNYVYTFGAWLTLIGVSYLLYQASTTKDKKKTGVAVNHAAKAPIQESRKEDKKKKQRMENFASESAKKAVKTEEKEKPAQQFGNADDNEKQESLSNREFAKQLAKAQEGLKLAAKTDGSKQREKSVKQSRANKLKKADDKLAAPEVAAVPSAPSSTGADADDDATPALSPETQAVDASGVADMLEPAPAGPSILRLTDTESKQQKKKVTKTPEPVETKKQRQNRKKAEAAKVAREEAEKERKVLEEKQRRTARIAEGRPAKDGSQFTAVNGGKSAWTEGAAQDANNKVAETSALYAPLDTSDAPAAPPAAAPAAKPDSSLKPENSWMSSLPSEEEQMEMLKEESDEWSTVKTKSSRKAAKKAATPVESGDEPQTKSAPVQAKQPVVNNKPAKLTSSQSFGSFSALTTKDDGAEEVEEEWEV